MKVMEMRMLGCMYGRRRDKDQVRGYTGQGGSGFRGGQDKENEVKIITSKEL